MTELFHTGRESGAKFSPCRVWRYQLWRTWDPERPAVLFIGLNPSTADETEDDPTIRRCIDFAERWGFGTYLMGNLFGYRSTDPKGMRATPDPVGPENDQHIIDLVGRASKVVVAWGCHPGIDDRANHVLSLIPEPYCLKPTKDGYPWHPLYVAAKTKPIRYHGRQ